jgi:hypothetical protein
VAQDLSREEVGGGGGGGGKWAMRLGEGDATGIIEGRVRVFSG